MQVSHFESHPGVLFKALILLVKDKHSYMCIPARLTLINPTQPIRLELWKALWYYMGHFEKGCSSVCARDWSHKHVPQENFWFQAFWDRFWCCLGVKQQELDDQLPNLVIVLEAFKTLAQFKAVTLQMQQSSRDAQEKFF